MTEMYRGLKIEQQYYGWSASDDNADAEFADGAWRVSGGLFFTSISSKQNLFDQIDEHFADKANLTWEFCDGGTWTARSAVGTEDNPFLYRIDVIEDGTFDVIEDGTFDVNRTDSELIPAFDKGRRFETVLKTLDDAKQLCEEAELVAIDQANFVAKYGKE